MELRNVILFILIFALGATSVSFIYEVNSAISESPNTVINPIGTISETITAAATGKAVERISPGDHIKEDQIKVYNDKIELDVQNAVWSKFVNTNSMDPFLDENSNGIEVAPKSADDIKIGDVISYESRTGGIIIHRVVNIDEDNNGTFYTMKGDNNPLQDPERVRFNQVKGILVGILY